MNAFSALTFALLATPIPSRAGFLKIWQLTETEKSPVLVTAQILAVHKGPRAEKESATWTHDTFRMTADVRILRSYTRSGDPLPISQTQVIFYQYNPPPRIWVCCTPPPLANLKPGETVILPLQENENPSQPWKLTANEGVNATLPARAELKETDPPPATGRAFILRELVNSLSNGTPQEAFQASRYLAFQERGVAPELIPLLAAEIDDDRDRWAEVATSAIAAAGVERPTFVDLLKPASIPTERPGSQNLAIVRSALDHLKPSPATDALLIRTLITDAPVHTWGSANSLLEFADDPVLTTTLRQALKDDVSGTSYIAWTLVHTGHKTVLAEALDRALLVCDRPGVDHTDLQGAAALLRDFGSDRQLDQLAALVRKYQMLNRDFYSVLWQFATEANNPREARVLSVVLKDRQPVDNAPDGMRVCDFAKGVLERATGQQFASIEAARAWLDAHHIAR